MKGSSTALHPKLMLLAPGCLLGSLIAIDPYIIYTLSPSINLKIEGVNILRLYPYKLSSLLPLSFILLYIFAALFRRMALNNEKTFIILFLVTYQTIRLHRFGLLEATDLIVAIYLLIFVAKMFIENKKATGTSLIILNLFFLFCILPSSVNGGILSIPRLFLKLGKCSAISLLLANYLNSEDLIKLFIKWLIIFTSISAIIAIFQELIFLYTGIALVGSLEHNEARLMFEITSYGKFLRVPGLMPVYIMLSHFILLSLMLVFNLYLYYKPKRIKITRCLLIFSLFMIIALFLTFSKIVILGFFVGIFLSVLLRWPQRIIHLFSGALGLFSLAYLSGLLQDVYLHIDIGDMQGRLQLLREGIHGFLNQHPWIGVGFGRGSRYTSHFLGWEVHNGIILAANQFGLIGLFSFLLILGYIFYKIILLNILVKDKEHKWIVRGFLVGFVCFVVNINVYPIAIDSFLWIYMGVIYAMWAVLPTRGSFC